MTRSFSQSISALVVAVACSSPAPIGAQTPADDVANTAWRLDAMIHLQRMRAYHDVDTGTQPTPATIPQRAMDADPSGIISSYQPNGDTQTSSNAFFQNLGTNGRTCFTCHQTQTGWSVSAQSVQDRFIASSGPIRYSAWSMAPLVLLPMSRPCRTGCNLQPVVEQRLDSNWAADSRKHGISSRRG